MKNEAGIIMGSMFLGIMIGMLVMWIMMTQCGQEVKMGIWPKLIMEYFYRNEQGTSADVRNWILNNRIEIVEKYYEKQGERMSHI